MEILISVIAKITEYTVKPIGRQLGYLFYYNYNITNLANQVDMLKVTRESVQHRVDEARNNVEAIQDAVERWLHKVDDQITESCEILHQNEGQENKKCCSSSGLCLNSVQRRYRVSRKAKKMADVVLEINKQGSFERVSYNVPLAKVESSTKISDFMNFESRISTMEEIMNAILDDNVNRIGVYGMGGVGKTMMVREISRKNKDKKSFLIVTSTVSQIPNLKRIQGELGDKLGLKFKQETAEGRAIKLYNRLKMEESILIVLDDIWNYIDLETIGIPSVEDHKGCKILFTSRDTNTLSDIDVHKIFEVKVLGQEESWNLFIQMAGEINDRSIAMEIVKECAHLPIAITTVAKALRNKPLSIWKDALNQLRNPIAMNIRGMDDKVYASLKLSYEQLQSKEAKLVFLLCSMFPEDHHIKVEDLHVYAMGMGLLQGIETLAQGRYRIIKLVDDLLSSSLLLGIEHRDDCVKMHDLIRDVAILIASKDDLIHTLSYVQGLNKWEEEKMSGNYTVVYLQFGDLYNSPPFLPLPKVQLLMLGGPYPNIHELSRSFFKEMKELRVLELRSMKISLSPPSLESCANLRSLHLIRCKLENIDIISELSMLEILSFEGSDIIKIPMVISQLTQLKLLDLSSCHKLRVISPNILLRLTKLEELYLTPFNGWEADNLNRKRKNVSLSELKPLSRLSALSISIPDEQIIPKQLFSRELNLEKFDIHIGHWPRTYWDETVIRRLHLCMETGCHVDDWIKMLLKKSDDLHLGGSTGERLFRFEFDENVSSHLKHLHLYSMREVKHLIHESKKKAFWKILTNLERIEITDCKMMEVVIVMESGEATKKIELTRLNYLELDQLPQLVSFCSKIDNSENVGKTFFNDQVSLPNLEHLIIRYASSLKMMICHKVLVPDSISSFAKLKTVEIVSCNNLEKVFPSNMKSILNCLQVLTVKSCNLLEGIFESVEEASAIEQRDDWLPRLSSFKLIDLPNLKYVWSKDPLELQFFENLQDFSIIQCPKLRRAYPVKVLSQLTSLEIEYGELMEIFDKLKSMKSSKNEIVELWDDDGPELLPKLKTLKLCGYLNYKWNHLPTEIVRILHNLRQLELRGIFVEEIFSNCSSNPLVGLQLYKLPKLKHLWKELESISRMNSSFLQNLEDLEIEECSRLNSLFPSSSVSSLTNLRNLRSLRIHKCHGLRHLMNPRVAAALVRLIWMTISGCKMMTTVISSSEVEEEIIFKNLERLTLEDLPRLTSFHSGKCIIRFPRLDYVSIWECPEMKVFSVGITTTPLLEKSRVSLWSGSLEHIIQNDSEEEMVEDINLIIREASENNYDFGIQHLFTQHEKPETMEEVDQFESAKDLGE